MAKIKKEELRPGMKLRNTKSGMVGEVRADPERPKMIMDTHPKFVQVKLRARTGATKGRWFYPTWRLEHLEIPN